MAFSLVLLAHPCFAALCLFDIDWFLWGSAETRTEPSSESSPSHTHTHGLQTWTALDFHVPPLTRRSSAETMEGLQTEGVYLKTKASEHRNAGGLLLTHTGTACNQHHLSRLHQTKLIFTLRLFVCVCV